MSTGSHQNASKKLVLSSKHTTTNSKHTDKHLNIISIVLILTTQTNNFKQIRLKHNRYKIKAQFISAQVLFFNAAF